jgi:UDP-N-acetylglucosamine acyltransferase
MTTIHPTAIVDKKAELGKNVQVGPWALVGSGVKIGEGTVLCARSTVDGPTVVGKNCHIGIGAVVGSQPQDLKYQGEQTGVRLGDNVTIREYVTINRATGDEATTVIGNNCLLMAYSHVAHNCELDSNVIMANAATLAGHIRIGEGAIIGGLVAIHQFVQVGCFAIVGGKAAVRKDIVPFVKASDNPCRPYGLNIIGLKRKGYSPEKIRQLRHAYRIIFRMGLTQEQALERLRTEYPENSEIAYMVEFIERSERGLAR